MPNVDMDETWARFTETGSEWMPKFPPFVKVPREEAQKATGYSLETAVRTQDEHDSGYLVSLEMFHQLHCLVSGLSIKILGNTYKTQDTLRKFVHFDYYQNLNPDWAKTTPPHSTH
ncbi:hypothetical protein DL98DRAFT_24233 [Cadophora sp. DSE1049]|nr:hypothetical protein DL98DRAFT_24233 [Cadophora sp. DSE1049]